MSGLPYCEDLWNENNTLPKDYEGCSRRANEAIEGSFPADCGNGLRYDGFPGEAAGVLGGEIFVFGDGEITETPEFKAFKKACPDGNY